MRECLEEAHLSEKDSADTAETQDSSLCQTQISLCTVKTIQKKENAKMSAVIMHMYDSFVTNGLPQAFRGLTSFDVSFLLNRCELSKSAVN